LKTVPPGTVFKPTARELGKASGARAGGRKAGSRGAYVEPRDTAPTLRDLGIDKKTSASIAAALASISLSVVSGGSRRPRRRW
jgi:hypothetical protein